MSTVITCLQGNKLHKGGKIARLKLLVVVIDN